MCAFLLLLWLAVRHPRCSLCNSKLTKIQLCFLHTLGGSVGANVLHVPADAQSEWDDYKITLAQAGECLHNYCHSQLPAQHETGIELNSFVEFLYTLHTLWHINNSQLYSHHIKKYYRTIIVKLCGICAMLLVLLL